MKSACIAFLKAAEALQPLPVHIESLLKERVEASFALSRPGLELRFDDASCSHKGVYAFGLDNLRMSARSPDWDGEWMGSLSNILDGNPLDFSRVVVESGEAPAMRVVASDPRRWNKVTYGLLLGGALGASGGYAFSPNKKSRPANIAVFGLSGALSGALLGFTF
jgi:hypothetical protein